MFAFSPTSARRLAECHPILQVIFGEVIKHRDCTILCGYRGEAEQNEAFSAGRSKVRFPESKHNQKPSLAVDAWPYPVDWSDRERGVNFAGFVLGIAEGLGYRIRWGGDWDMDGEVKDNAFDDLVHFEVVI